MKIKIFILIFSAMAMSISLFAQGPDASSADKMSDDIKETQKQIKQLEQETKRTFDQLRQEQINKRVIENTQRTLERKQEKARNKNNGLGSLVIFSRSIIIQLLLLLIAAVFLYLSYKFITRELRRAKNEGEPAGEEILIRIDNWTYENSDFKNFVSVLSILIDQKELDLNSAEFKRSFLEDLVTTEILCQIAIETRAGEDEETKNKLLNYEDYLKNVDVKNEDIKKSITNYKKRIKSKDLQYLEYYQDFLNLLLVFGNKVQVKSFEAFSRNILVNKLVKDTDKKLASQGDVNKIKTEIDGMIKNFLTRFRVVVNSGL